MFNERILTFELCRYDEQTNDFVAWYEGRRVRVDPYVTNLWPQSKKSLGMFTFAGHWHEDCFLPEKEL